MLTSPISPIASYVVGRSDYLSRDFFENSSRTFRKLRIIFNVSKVWPFQPDNEQHIILALLSEDDMAVTIEMQAGPSGGESFLEFKLSPVSRLPAKLLSFDIVFQEAVAVGTAFIAIVNDWKMHQFLFDNGSNNCYEWL